MATQEGAEQYGGKYPTGNISAEQMDALDARAAKADVTPEQEARFLDSQTKGFRNRRWN